jgi:aldehyde:ferredoxin oxidoreductase
VLTGGPFPGSGRHSIGAKSPLTGTYGESEAGGYFGYELKRAGYDAVILEGVAKSPCYIWIIDDHVEIVDATDLWGKTTGTVQSKLQEKHGSGIRVAQIGPAGEKLVRFANVTHDLKHFAGRSGMGAVMGSKKVRAIAVKGSQKVQTADPDLLKEKTMWMKNNFKKYMGPLHNMGSSNLIVPLNELGGLPTRNFQESSFEGAEKISGEQMHKDIVAKTGTCYACPIRCKREVEVGEPYNVDTTYGGPEYETLASLGSNCGIDNLGAIAKGNQLCNELGLDTISAGMCVSFLMECYEKGLVKAEDLNGLDFKFGNAEAMLTLIKLIAAQEGIGTMFTEGIKQAAAKIGNGSEEFALHIKGQELPMHEPRLKMGLGLGYAVSPTGADHCHNIHDTAYVKEGPRIDYMRSLGMHTPLPADDLSLKKVRMFVLDFFRSTLQNSAVTCYYVPWGPQDLADLVKGMTGWNTTVFELSKVIERGVTLARCFNVREGFTSEDDYLNKRFFTPLQKGPLKGVAILESDLEHAKLAFYKMMGWDEKGVPTEEKLYELGMEWVQEQQ